MKYKINKQAILEEFELNPFKIYAKYKIKKDLNQINNGTFKPDSQTKPDAELEVSTTTPSEDNNIKHHNEALNDALAMLK